MTLETKSVSFMADGKELLGHLAWDTEIEGERPGVLVFPEWWGLNDYIKKRTEQVASLGYFAMGVDMYGNGKTADHPEEAGSLMNGVLGDLDLLKSRVEAAYQALRNEELADSNRMGAIGYCFGGALVLNMARFGMDLQGVVSFHGALDSMQKPGPGEVKAKILVCHGAADQFIPDEAIVNFKKEMEEASADFEFVDYQWALHGFTNPAADERGKAFNLPLAYDEKADLQSWQAMESHFEKVF
ncbi:MAG: dienelactone hydrolase family protein [SAR324 cluster bacterium]|jgi:dienelactone hydrolase|nr:dienelactone hydrolase family protein [SAR324 cluster bacterium]MDP7332879.1 dienelactone hydrolase family protein [SAR324 cluster bacterium]MDP7498044.1 dienelactone hydrolase family protein [SAR324 cluster bacterium]MEE1577535.1 dienelactone hydrolase family protein [Deltaproteobacteria bacterium]HJL88562.1 dienelactone hydrolase family protein [SAR324 cluster bacterium]|tara:strand:+ start:494 stop:1222 length:729 start_codon:yes stop_codon:yes gene_type:complete